MKNPSSSTRNFTLCLSASDAEKVYELLRYFGGSVGGFATSVLRDYVELTPDQIVKVRRDIQALAEANKNQKQDRSAVVRSGIRQANTSMQRPL